jgi:NAD(P) transhydrogenase
MVTNNYDLVVIGSGPAGQKSAIAAAKLGKRVAIVDREEMIGGVCLQTGTIPSRAVREAILYLTVFASGRSTVRTIRLSRTSLSLIFSARVSRVRAIEKAVIKSQLNRNDVTTSMAKPDLLIRTLWKSKEMAGAKTSPQAEFSLRVAPAHGGRRA